MNTRYTRLIVATLLALSLGGLRPASGFAAPAVATTVSGCPTTESALQTDITAAGAGGTIEFTCSSATTIPFDSADGGTGQITLSQDLTFDASSAAGPVTLDGGNATRLFEISSGAAVTLDGLTLRHGNGWTPAVQSYCLGGTELPNGGAIANHGTLTITDSILSNNQQNVQSIDCGSFTVPLQSEGGAIYNDGILTLTGSTLTGNTAPYNLAFPAMGGAIFNEDGQVSIDRSTLSGNVAGPPNALTVSGNGGAIATNGGTLDTSATTFTGNGVVGGDGSVAEGSNGLGAAIYTTCDNRNGLACPASPHVTVTSSSFGSASSGPSCSANPNHEPGDIGVDEGTVTISHSTFTCGQAGSQTALVNGPFNGEPLAISDSTFSGYQQGAVDDAGAPLTVTGSTFKDNTTSSKDSNNASGGAIIAGTTATIADSTFTNNTNTIGGAGAIMNLGTLTVTNSTFTNNTSSGSGGSLGDAYNELVAGGGAIVNSGTLTITGSTLAGNTASATPSYEDSGEDVVGSGGGAILSKGTLTITGSTLAGNTASATTCDNGHGGAILMHEGNLTLTNSTIVGNRAGACNGGGSAVWVYAPYATSPQYHLEITADTVAGNSGDGALYDASQGVCTNSCGHPDTYGPVQWTIGQDIFATNTGGNCDSGTTPFYAGIDYVPIGFAEVTDTGYTLTDTNFYSGGYSPGTYGVDVGNNNFYIAGMACAGSVDNNWNYSLGTGDQTGLALKLDPAGLADNGNTGGPQTVALESGSPAIDVIPTSSNLCPATDERGNARPDASGETACDAGAYESAYIATTASVTSSANPSVFGQEVTFTASVSNTEGSATPIGTVQFSVDGSKVGDPVPLNGNGEAAYSTSSLSVTGGTNHAVTADYTPSGNAFMASSGSLSGGQEVDRAATTTQLTSSANPSATGQQVTFTATVRVSAPGAGTPTGTVTLSDGGAPITGCGRSGSVALDGSGTATCTTNSLSLGGHTISAVYGGSGTLVGSTSSALTQNVDTSLSGYPPLASGAYDLSQATLSGAYLVQANLSGANGNNATLSKANLTDANLSGANLSQANLKGANLTDANLSGANLTQANLKGATGMDSATLTNVTWTSTTCPDGTSSKQDGGTCAGHL